MVCVFEEILARKKAMAHSSHAHPFHECKFFEVRKMTSVSHGPTAISDQESAPVRHVTHPPKYGISEARQQSIPIREPGWKKKCLEHKNRTATTTHASEATHKTKTFAIIMLACFGGGSLFSNRGRSAYNEPPTVTAAETIMKLREHIDRQEKREAFLEIKMTQLAQEAKERLARGDKKAAVGIMKKRKLYQNEQAKIANVKMTLETQAMNLESSAGTAEAFQAMTAGTNTMQKIRLGMGGVEKIDDMMMDMQDEFQMADEVNTAIGQTIDPLMGGFDEDDLMKELQELEGPTKQQAPAKPLKKLSSPWQSSKPQKGELEELRKLEAELA
jgi:charged multivesicular body protein 4A/B